MMVLSYNTQLSGATVFKSFISRWHVFSPSLPTDIVLLLAGTERQRGEPRPLPGSRSGRGPNTAGLRQQLNQSKVSQGAQLPELGAQHIKPVCQQTGKLYLAFSPQGHHFGPACDALQSANYGARYHSNFSLKLMHLLPRVSTSMPTVWT